jgi:hypothetical protein
MKTSLLVAAAVAALAVTPALAQDRTTVTEHADGTTTTTTKTVKKDAGGAPAGAVGGALAGAVVAGPVGAVVGGIAGATVGHAAAPPSEVRTYVTTQQTAPVAYTGQIEVGKTINGDTITWMEVPKYPKYHWANLNSERVVVDENHNVVAVYTD